MGVSSTHPSDTGVTRPTDTGVDTLRVLLKITNPPGVTNATLHLRPLQDIRLEGEKWFMQSFPAFHMVAFEGNPDDGSLWKREDILERGERLRNFCELSGMGLVSEVGVSRVDTTTSRPFDPGAGRAFVGGMAALELPRMEATRRGTPVHSVWWTGAKSAKIAARVYDESHKYERLERFARVRFEAQLRIPSGRRVPLDVVADPLWQRETFRRRWEPMRKAVDGVKASGFPVLAQALADEFRYGYRSWQEVDRLAGALIITASGTRPSDLNVADRRTFYRRRAELREAGYVCVDDFMEPVVVDLGEQLDQALEEFGS